MLIIPDVHGRIFWQKAVEGRENEEIIFLGDYVDPYPREGLPEDAPLTQLEKIIQFKKQHPNNVTLLLGNHDASYMFREVTCSRHNWFNANYYYNLLFDNLNLFQLAYTKKIGDTNFIFSHAGILPQWIEDCPEIFPKGTTIFKAIEILNDSLQNVTNQIIQPLRRVSHYRGGKAPFGSVIWADVEEHASYAPLENIYQIFGHSQQQSDPIIKSYYADLDCRRAFILTAEGKLEEL